MTLNTMTVTLEKKKLPTKYVILINDVYINVVTSASVCDDELNVFLIKIKSRISIESLYFHLSDG
jgi:hypothetical protein